MEHTCQPVVGIDRRQHPDLVPAPAKLVRERLDMSEDTARVRVGIGANKSYAHLFSLAVEPVW
jgi:hypothetical protein